MKLFACPESIECQTAYVIAKKVQPSTPLNHEILGRCIKYLCKRDGEASITKELSEIPNKKMSAIARTKLGDSIHANEFYVLVKGFRVEKINLSQFSGAHKGNAMNTSDHTFAEITVPYSVGENKQVELPKGYVPPLLELKSKKPPKSK